jgi:hypothetical protein
MPKLQPVNGQDFENVVFSNRKPTAATEKKAPNQPGEASRRRAEEGLPQEKVSTTQKQTLQKLRILAGFKSQKELAAATKGKIPAARINELENGKGAAPSGKEKELLFKLVKMKF